MTTSIKKEEIDQRKIKCLIPFIFYLIISRVYLDDEMKMSKRIWSIFSILFGLYQLGLFVAVNPRDIIIEMFPVRMALFEIVQIFNFIFALFFLIIIGVDLILTDTKEKIVDPENLTLFQIIAQNQKIIQERVEILDNKRKAKFEEPPESISENQ